MEQEIFDQELDEVMGFVENPELVTQLVVDHKGITPMFAKSVTKLSPQKASVLQTMYPKDKHAAMFMLLLGIKIGRRLRDNDRVPIHPEG